MKKIRKRIYIIFMILIAILILSVNNQKIVESKKTNQITSSKDCKLCHVQLYLDWSKTSHYQNFKELSSFSSFNYRSKCEICHNSHNKKEEVLIPSSFEEANQKCGDRCHFTNNDSKKRQRIKIIKQNWIESNHGQGGIACTQCHNQHQSNNLQSKEFCLNCHGPTNVISYSSKTKEHYADKNCIDCHDPHKKSLDLNLFKRKYIHYPIAKSKCFKCHSPHNAFSDKLTKDHDNNLCYKCHSAKEYVFPNTGHAKAQGIIGKGLCVNCHRPHSAGYLPLLRQDITSICLSCHNNYGAHHFLGNIKLRKEIECITCHNPHGGANRSALKVNSQNICKQCHKEA
ncbi:cytochrome c3 family protein [Selenihalanaerobacter shriftii]|uniref:Doubled CXXCH domain-containing protein n=1 Tax=Selenihalanaerobacter shriftii TaxID=142842 RepID=A0A1T4L592_9FIRM|nr:cytochrome c3 family protein [Selenihalanaerobacter shriftii]SJZ49721.1 doubled CXXCH domain-containing protein [Selenihalanaerobacter shriftii]